VTSSRIAVPAQFQEQRLLARFVKIPITSEPMPASSALKATDIKMVSTAFFAPRLTPTPPLAQKLLFLHAVPFTIRNSDLGLTPQITRAVCFALQLESFLKEVVMEQVEY
jgi:hypothetical protein